MVTASVFSFWVDELQLSNAFVEHRFAVKVSDTIMMLRSVEASVIKKKNRFNIFVQNTV